MKSVFERAESLPHISGTKPWKLEVPGKSGGPKLWEDQMGISLPFVCPAQGLLCCERSLETSWHDPSGGRDIERAQMKTLPLSHVWGLNYPHHSRLVWTSETPVTTPPPHKNGSVYLEVAFVIGTAYQQSAVWMEAVRMRVVPVGLGTFHAVIWTPISKCGFFPHQPAVLQHEMGVHLERASDPVG